MKHYFVLLLLLLPGSMLSAKDPRGAKTKMAVIDSLYLAKYEKMAFQAEEVYHLAQRVTELAASIQIHQARLDSARLAWQSMCEKYIASPNRTLEEMDILIANTDSVSETPLYESLKNARVELSDSSKDAPMVKDKSSGVSDKKITQIFDNIKQ